MATPKQNHVYFFFVRLLLGLVMLVVGITIGYVLFANKNPHLSTSAIQVNPSTTQHAPDQYPQITPKSKEYNNLGVTFEYPLVASVKEDMNGSTQYIANFTLQGENFRFDKEKRDTENEPQYNQTTLTKSFNGITWKVVLSNPTSKYCDAGNCGEIAPSYYMYKNGYRYSFTYYSNDLKDTIEKILTTFRFI